MEQNLSERERKIRLSLGIVSGLAAAVSLGRTDKAITLILVLLAIGFGLNYFTCFCGTKKALKSIKNSFLSD